MKISISSKSFYCVDEDDEEENPTEDDDRKKDFYKKYCDRDAKTKKYIVNCKSLKYEYYRSEFQNQII